MSPARLGWGSTALLWGFAVLGVPRGSMHMTGETDAPDSEKAGRAEAQLLDPPAENSFVLHLKWHIEINGTRPGGLPGTPGKPWERDDLVEAIDAARRKRGGRRERIEVRGDVAKNIRNWLRGKSCSPYWRNMLEDVLFGDNAAYNKWRLRFRQVASSRGGDTLTDVRSATPSSPMADFDQEDKRKIDETHSRVNEIFAALVPQNEEINRRGVTEAALRAMVIKIEAQMHNAPIEDILRRIEDFVESTLRERERRTLSSNEVPELKALRAEAGRLVDAGQFDKVSSPFDAALQAIRKARAERAAGEVREDVRLLEEGADYERLTFNIDRAVDRYVEAANLLFPHDRGRYLEYLYSKIVAHIEDGHRHHDSADLLVSVCLSRNLLLKVGRRSIPEAWAKLQNSLGMGLFTLGNNESGTVKLEEAALAFRAALNTFRRGSLEWATVQNNLGMTFVRLGEREGGTSRAVQAIACQRAALKIFRKQEKLLKWANIQVDLGDAFVQLAVRKDDGALFEQGVAAYRAAVEVFNRIHNPINWIGAQLHLGYALVELGRRTNNTGCLKEAIAVNRAIIELCGPDASSHEYASAQHGLGTALCVLAECEGGTKLLEQAIAAYLAALKVITRKTAPRDWAAAQVGFGDALHLLAKREQGGTARLETAVAAYRDALLEFTEQSEPLLCEATVRSMQDAERLLADRQSDGMQRKTPK